MKRILQLLTMLLVTGIIFSCKKEVSMITYEGGTAPTLKASTTGPLVLVIANKNNEAVNFTWNNPDYQFSTGSSSQNVTYTLQVDTTGANFSSPAMQQLAVANELSRSLSVQDLNGILTKLNLLENIPHNVEFRLKSSLANNSVPLYSNVVKMVITPYLDVAVPVPPTGELYITGDAVTSGWTNTPPANQRAIKESSTVYSIVYNFVPGKQYKFLSTQNQWQPQYGGSSSTGGDIGYNMGTGSDPAAIPTPDVAGTYKVTLNFKTGKYTVVKQ